MDAIRNIVIISGDDNTVLTTTIEPVISKQPLEMAITSISHGPMFNVNEDNSQLKFSYPSLVQFKSVSYDKPRIDTQISCNIPFGNYQTSFDLLRAIEKSVKEAIIEHEVKNMLELMDVDFINTTTDELQILATITTGKDAGRLKVVSKNIKFQAYGNETPWSLLAIEDGQLNAPLDNYIINNGSSVGLLYANIVENSYINGKLSRFLNVVPLKNNIGYSNHEFVSPNFVPINVKEFNNVKLELADFNGNFLEFDPKYKTIISLKIRPINTPEQ